MPWHTVERLEPMKDAADIFADRFSTVIAWGVTAQPIAANGKVQRTTLTCLPFGSRSMNVPEHADDVAAFQQHERRYWASFSSKMCPSAAAERAAEARDRGRSPDAWIEPRIAPGNLDCTIACSIRSIRALIAATSG